MFWVLQVDVSVWLVEDGIKISFLIEQWTISKYPVHCFLLFIRFIALDYPMVCVDGLVCCLCFGRKLPVVGSTRMFLGFCFWRFYVIRLLLYQTLYFILE